MSRGLFLQRGRGGEEERTYMITNGEYPPAYINIKPEFLVRSFVCVLGIQALTGLVDSEGRVDVRAEVPGVDVGVTAEGGVHDVWLGGVEVDLEDG